MSKQFLGKGLGFPITLTIDGILQTAEYEESVRQSILIILGTARGERAMRPDFGCGIYEFVFEIPNATTIGRLAYEVQETLLRQEPRIDVLDVRVQTGAWGNDQAGETGIQVIDNGNVLLINIDYQVRATNNVFNLVYPFYLERSPG